MVRVVKGSQVFFFSSSLRKFLVHVAATLQKMGLIKAIAPAPWDSEGMVPERGGLFVRLSECGREEGQGLEVRR